MNITDLITNQTVIAQIHQPDAPINEFPAKFLGVQPTEDGTWCALFLFQDHDRGVWDDILVRSLTIAGPWTIDQTHTLFTVRAEQYVTVTELAEQIAIDGVATEEIERQIITALDMDPRYANGQTLLGEDAAERAANEIPVAV